MKKLIIASITIAIVFIASCVNDPIIPAGMTIDDLPCPTNKVIFRTEILPLIVSNCAYSGCHDAATAEDDVILDTYENIMKEVTPGKPNDSELYESITEKDVDDIMPPPPSSPLTSAQISLIKDWINQGAEDIVCNSGCDTTVVSFANDVFPIVQAQCIGCHNPNNLQGNIDLSNHASITPYINDGSFWGSINHETGYVIMPPSGGQMDDCNLNKIKIWIQNGALND